MRGQRKRGSEDVWNGHGGYMGIKKAKLVGQFAEQAQGVAKQAGIFRGMVLDTKMRDANSGEYIFKHYYKITEMIFDAVWELNIKRQVISPTF